MSCAALSDKLPLRLVESRTASDYILVLPRVFELMRLFGRREKVSRVVKTIPICDLAVRRMRPGFPFGAGVFQTPLDQSVHIQAHRRN